MIKETDAKLLIVDSINGQYVSLVYFWDLDIDVCLINGSEGFPNGPVEDL